MARNTGIADRLREFGQSKFGSSHGWKKQFADALGITTQHLDRYLSAASEPGNKMYLRLINLGCDIQWLLTGDPSPSAPALSHQDQEILRTLRAAGIDTVDKVKYLLEPEHLAADIAAAAVKEIASRYKAPKRKARTRLK
jgi:transcriptional regulator with XRE-family HTH domain